MNTLKAMKVAALFAAIAVVSVGCAGVTNPGVQPPDIKTNFEQKYGIKVDFRRWKVAKSALWIDGGKEKMFSCSLQIVSMHQSSWDPFTVVSFCTAVGESGVGEREFEFSSFMRAGMWAHRYMNVSRVEEGKTDSFSYRDVLDRAWSGFVRKDLVYNVGENPVATEVNHIFLAFKSSSGTILGIRIIAYRDDVDLSGVRYVLNNIGAVAL